MFRKSGEPTTTVYSFVWIVEKIDEFQLIVMLQLATPAYKIGINRTYSKCRGSVLTMSIAQTKVFHPLTYRKL